MHISTVSLAATRRSPSPPFHSTSSPPFRSTPCPPFCSTPSPPFRPTSSPPFRSTSSPPFRSTLSPPFRSTSSPPFRSTSSPRFCLTLSRSPSHAALSVTCRALRRMSHVACRMSRSSFCVACRARRRTPRHTASVQPRWNRFRRLCRYRISYQSPFSFSIRSSHQSPVATTIYIFICILHIRNNTQKYVAAIYKDLPPPNDNFILDFEKLQKHFLDPDQLQASTEFVLISLVIQCCDHAPRAEFLLFAIVSLCKKGYINRDSFLPSLLSSVFSEEASTGLGNPTSGGVSSSGTTQTGTGTTSFSLTSHPNCHSSNPTSPIPPLQAIGSPSLTTGTEPSSSATHLSPVKSADISIQQSGAHFLRESAIGSLRGVCCKIILKSLKFNLKPATHSEILSSVLNWLVNLEGRHNGEKGDLVWVKNCLEIIWVLVEEDRCRVPFYELVRSDLQCVDGILDDEVMFTLVLEIHRRRDTMALHMRMLDQHLHSPTFATQRFISQSAANVYSFEVAANTRYSPITYPSMLGEPLHGEDIANCVQNGSLDWERALRCIRHAFHTTPSPDWWRRVMVVAPANRSPAQSLIPGAVFTTEMLCEATVDRIIQLLRLTNSDECYWQDWLIFSDVFHLIVKNGCLEFVELVDKLALYFTEVDSQVLRSNHLTWLFCQVLRADLVMNALTSDSRKTETTKKLLSFHREDRNLDSNSPLHILLDFVPSCQTLRIWSLNSGDLVNSERLHKGKQIDEWWRQFNKGEIATDYMNLDERSIGMFWVVSYTMTQPACEMVMNWLSSAGNTEYISSSNMQPGERINIMRERSPLPISLLSGLSLHSRFKLAVQMEDVLFSGQVVPSIAMVETYTRLLLIAPHAMFRSHFQHLSQRNPSILSKSGITLLILEILNYRLYPLYRYNGKNKMLMFDVMKIITTLKGKRGDHRAFRLAENLCINLLLSLRDFFSLKKEPKGVGEFTETVNRVVITTLAVIIKTRGIAEAEQVIYLQTMLEQMMTNSHHTWSEKTLRYFPAILSEPLKNRLDKRSLSIQAWQQAEATVIHQCSQLLPPSADPSYVMTYISHSFPQHRQYLCAGAWILMNGCPDNINSANLAHVLRDFSPEEVTANIYTMVDVLLHHIHAELQHGHSLQDLLLKTSANLSFFVWTHELLPLDILLLALIDRDDDPHALLIVVSMLDKQELQQRVKMFCINFGPPEHLMFNGVYKRVEVQKALGNCLSWKDRYPTFFDDAGGRLLPVIPLIIYRLVENEAVDAADHVLVLYSKFLAYYPLRFTFVRDILSYFYGHLPGKLIFRILNVLDLNKIPFSESFPQYIGASSPALFPPPDYFAALLLSLVNNVLPPLNSNPRVGSVGHMWGTHPSSRPRAPTPPDLPTQQLVQRAFYQIQDPGTYTQLVLETMVVELLSLPVPAAHIVTSLVHIVVHIHPTLIQSGAVGGGPHGVAAGQSSTLPTSPSGGSTDSVGANRSSPPASGIKNSFFMSRSGYSCRQLSCLMIQACGLLLAQLPADFHVQIYIEAARILNEYWWMADGKRGLSEQNSALGYALTDPSSAIQDNTSTAVGNLVALLHSLFSNLPQEWLEGAHVIVQHLRPISSIAMLRTVFRIMGPLLPRLVAAHPLFNKILALLFSAMADVFGKTTQAAVPITPIHPSEISDIIDFLHHIVNYEGEGGAVQLNSKPRAEVLAVCRRGVENLRSDVRHLLSHLTTDVTTSVYAATHPKLVPAPS